jgi:hypothetical protein
VLNKVRVKNLHEKTESTPKPLNAQENDALSTKKQPFV